MRTSALRIGIFALLAAGASALAAEAQVAVLDALNGRDPAAPFSVFGSGGNSVLPHQHTGPQFVLAVPTIITEIGAFVGNCGQIDLAGPHCPDARPLIVEIRRANGGLPDPHVVIAAYQLTDDGDPLTIAYESAHPNLLLPAGTYFALFAPGAPTDAGIVLGSADGYQPGAVNAATLDPGSSATALPNYPMAVRITGSVAVPTPAPIADASVRAGLWASTNFGRAPLLTVKQGASPDNTRRSYLKFEIGARPDVQRAILRLYAGLSDAGGTTPEIIVYAVGDTSWDELRVTWNTRPGLGAVLGRFVVATTTPRWFDVDVTAFVRAEQRAGHTEVSLALRSLTHSSVFAEFASREAIGAAPQLVLVR